MEYRKYIASARWRKNSARLGELAAAGFCCRICNSDGDGRGLEAHHRTYENLGNERSGDLTALCRSCHRAVTDHLRRRRFSQRQPDYADMRPVLESPSPLFDPTVKEIF